MKIHIALTLLKQSERRSAGLISDIHRERLVNDLTQRIMGSPEGEAVILVPSLTGPLHSPRQGRWGEDEPHPHPDLSPEDH